MTITRTDIVAGPVPATGAEQTIPFLYKVFTPSEIEVVTGVIPNQVTIDPDLYEVASNTALDGQIMEGGTVLLSAGAVDAGLQVRLIAKPKMTQEQVYSDTSSRLKNLNEGLDRAALRAQRAAYDGALEGAGPELIEAATEAGEAAGAAAGAAAASLRLLLDGSNALSMIGLDFDAPFALRSIGPEQSAPASGIYMGSGGINLSLETLISSPAGAADSDNQRAQLALVATTVDDGNSEEQNLIVLTRIQTGYSKTWATSTAFAQGDNVSFGGSRNSVYRCIVPGVSAASGEGPTGQGQNILDGSVRWRWINDAAINSKTGTYLETVVAPGAGSSWGLTNNVHIDAGVISPFVAGFEQDLTNYSGQDSVIGGPDPRNKLGVWIAVQGTTRSTAALQISSANTDNDAAIWGAYFAGDRLASNAVIGIDASSAIGIGAGSGAGTALTPTFTTAFIRDKSISPTGLSLAGTYSSAQISLPQGGGTPSAISISGVKGLASIFDAATSPIGMKLDGVYSSSGISISGVTPSSYSSSGNKTISGYFDASTAPYGFNATGTYGTAAFASNGFSVLPGGAVLTTALRFTTLPPDYVSEAAAIAGGVVVGGVFRTGTDLQVRAA